MNHSRELPMNEHTTKCDIKMGRNKAKIKKIMHPNPNKKEIPNGVANYVTKKTSYGFGWTMIDSMTPEIDPFTIY